MLSVKQSVSNLTDNVLVIARSRVKTDTTAWSSRAMMLRGCLRGSSGMSTFAATTPASHTWRSMGVTRVTARRPPHQSCCPFCLQGVHHHPVSDVQTHIRLQHTRLVLSGTNTERMFELAPSLSIDWMLSVGTLHLPDTHLFDLRLLFSRGLSIHNISPLSSIRGLCRSPVCRQ